MMFDIRVIEIYQRRKMQGGVRVSTSNVNNKKEPAQFLLFKKLTLQIVICLLIYFILALFSLLFVINGLPNKVSFINN